MSDELGPDPDVFDRDAAAIASGIVCAALLTLDQARDQSVRWQDQPMATPLTPRHERALGVMSSSGASGAPTLRSRGEMR